jgi:hypothetical protein
VDDQVLIEVVEETILALTEETGVEIIEVGEPGPTGATGPQGPPGPPGGSVYVHDQGAPSTTWTVTHNLGRKPSITVVDSGDNVVHGEYQYLDDNTVLLSFSVPFGGRAYLN